MGRFARPCLTCNRLTNAGSYCEEHKPVKAESPRRKEIKRERYNSTYRKLAKHIRMTAETCHLCGGGPRPGDPWEADHIAPDTPGREYDLAPAHRSCNQQRGNKPLNIS